MDYQPAASNTFHKTLHEAFKESATRAATEWNSNSNKRLHLASDGSLLDDDERHSHYGKVEKEAK